MPERVPQLLADAQARLRPWQRRLEGESVREWEHRLNHTCYRCGHHEEDPAVLDAHENTDHHP